MSYILDALRRADAERGRAGVPGLHTQSVIPASGDESPGAAVKPFVWMGLGAAVVAAGALAWSLSGRDEAPAVALAPATAPAAPAAPQTPPVAAVPPQEAAVPEPPAAAKEPAPRPAAKRSSATPRAASAAGDDVDRAPKVLGVARPSTRPAAPPERIYALHELPEAVRRGMPTLTIGGSIYSPTPASRFLIVNGQIFHEGDQMTPEMTLEEIKLKAAVVRFRDHRVQITY